MLLGDGLDAAYQRFMDLDGTNVLAVRVQARLVDPT